MTAVSLFHWILVGALLLSGVQTPCPRTERLRLQPGGARADRHMISLPRSCFQSALLNLLPSCCDGPLSVGPAPPLHRCYSWNV